MRKQYQYRHGVASLIGGVFLILIIISGYVFYSLNSRATNELQDIIRNMSQLNSEKSQEGLTPNYVVPNDPLNPTGVILYITNTGSNLIKIKYIGTIDNDESNSYAQYNFIDMEEQEKINPLINTSIDPGKSNSYNIPIAGFNPIGIYLIKIISARGSIFAGTYSGSEFNSNPYMALTPVSSGSVNQLIISGARFPVDKSFTITILPQIIDPLPPFSTTSTFSETLPPLPFGRYTAYARLSDTQVLLVKTDFTVIPTIILNPSHGMEDTLVTLSGTGFAANSQLSATWDSATLSLNGNTITDNYGSIQSSVTFNVPTTATSGKHTITVSDEAPNSATSAFTVYVPQISLNPTMGWVNIPCTVAGSGFLPNSQLTATFDGAPITLSGASTKTDGYGNIPPGVTFAIPNTSDGDKTVVITDSGSNYVSGTFKVIP